MSESRRVITVLIADVEGSTALRSTLGDTEAQDRLDATMRVIGAAVRLQGGEVVKELGDGALAVFDAPGAAFDAALAMQKTVAAAEVDVGVRVGIHAGEAIVRPGDVQGMTVHVASRVCELAAGGEIVVSSAARGLAGPEPRWQWTDWGAQRLRGVDDPVALAELRPRGTPGIARRGHPAAADSLTPLPRFRTALVGRVQVLVELASLVGRPGLVTLVGFGGVGKTRLAVAAAEQAGRNTDLPVAFVDLSGISDGARVPAAIAQALGERDEPGEEPLDGITSRWWERELLLVVDNCEQVLTDAADAIDALLDGCALLRVLATSREPLDRPGERRWPVEPLGADGEASPALSLLVDLTRAIDPTFGPAAGLAELCAQVEGIPLALELLAPWVASVAVGDIAARLGELQAIPTRHGPGRHRSMTATLDWSWALLEPEQRALQRLAVCVRGFDLGLAAAVIGESDPVVLDLLRRLVERSLVVHKGAVGGFSRWRLLEPVREHAFATTRRVGRRDGGPDRPSRASRGRGAAKRRAVASPRRRGRHGSPRCRSRQLPCRP